MPLAMFFEACRLHDGDKLDDVQILKASIILASPRARSLSIDGFASGATGDVPSGLQYHKALGGIEIRVL